MMEMIRMIMLIIDVIVKIKVLGMRDVMLIAHCLRQSFYCFEETPYPQ